MSTINDLGMDLDELEALLNQFLADGLPCNEDLSQKRQLLETATQDTGVAERLATTTLGEVDSGLVGLRKRVTDEGTRFGETTQTAQRRLTEASTALDTAEKSALEKMSDGASENHTVAGAIGTDEATITGAFAHHQATVTSAEDGLKMGSLACTAAHQEGLKSVQDQARLVTDHSTETTQQLGQYRQGLDNFASQQVPAQFGLLTDWVHNELQSDRADSLNKAGNEAATSLANFEKSTQADATAAVETMNKSFSDMGNALQHGQETLSKRSQSQTQALISTLVQAQNDTSKNFDPGLKNAIKVSEKFAKLKQNLDKIINTVQHR